MYKNFGKRFFDIIAAAAGLLILSPLFVFITLLLYCSCNRQPFFFQPRPGLNNKIFVIIKFRTMLDSTDGEGNYLSDDQRMTRLGKFMRRNSLDELPQLWNVLLGDMSLVGPRPLLTEYLTRYSPQQGRRHEVRPGITGWAQIHGRDTISWTKKFSYDLYYVENLSLLLDSRILLCTAINLLFPPQLPSSFEKTVEKFTG
jgi:undecaprenyl phosphate N,N'-diacetylbacillosamine 1-phosphate transferase